MSKRIANAGDTGDGGPSLGGEDPPGEGNGNPLQYSWLENPVDGGAAKSQHDRATEQARPEE